MKNKKGFTLVELLAVIVILIVITLFALNKISEVMKKNNQNTVSANALTYIKAIENSASLSRITGDLTDGNYTVEQLTESGIKVSGTKPNSGKVLLVEGKVIASCLKYDKYTFTGSSSESEISKGNCDTDIVTSAEFNYSGHVESFKIVAAGVYKIELWGASGGNGYTTAGGIGLCDGGKGAYTSGNIRLKIGDILYFYVGEGGSSGGAGLGYKTTSFNGGGAGGYGGRDDNSGSGGGATDVRLVGGAWSSPASLRSRIMVASGGGGGSCVANRNYTFVGYREAAGLSNPSTTIAKWDDICAFDSVTQSSGYQFGKGRDAFTYEVAHAPGGGGGGYWGGTYCGVNNGLYSGGAGGTSYISGHTGCVAVAAANSSSPKNGCENNTTDNSCSIHYSNKKFDNTVMKAGNEVMPTHDGTSEMIGNTGNGFARINLIK